MDPQQTERGRPKVRAPIGQSFPRHQFGSGQDCLRQQFDRIGGKLETSHARNMHEHRGQGRPD